MPGTPDRRITHVIRDNSEADVAETAAAVRLADPDAALEDYAELARLLRAADHAGDRAAMVQIRELMDGIWPALTEEQRGRIEDGEFDW